MKFLKKLLSFTVIYKIIYTIQCIYYYAKDYGYISDTLYSDEFALVLKRYLNLNVKKDWIGRLYGVINPNIDQDGKYNPNNTIIELNDNYTSNEEYIKHWTHKQLNLIGNLFKIHNLYNYITLTFEHVGPDNLDNYLLIFDIASRKELTKMLKKTGLQLLIYFIIFILIFFVIL